MWRGGCVDGLAHHVEGGIGMERCRGRGALVPEQAHHDGQRARAAGIAMLFKLIQSAQARWRAVNAPHPVALVRAGATFENGMLD